MVKAMTRPLVPPAVARAAVEATRDDALLHGGASLMLWAGLRPAEVAGLLVRHWAPGANPRLTVRTVREEERTIRIASTASAILAAYLAEQDTEPDEPLLLGLQTQRGGPFLPQLFRRAMQRAGLEVSVHDLRRSAIAAVLDGGVPVAHVEAYFGISKTEPDRKDLVSLREDYDQAIAATLEAAFTA